MHVDGGVAGRLAAVARILEWRAGPEHVIRVHRAHAHLGVIERASVLVVHLDPGLAAVRGAVQAVGRLLRLDGGILLRVRRCVGLDHRVHHVRIRHRDGDADAPLGCLRESAALHFSPRGAGVRAFPQCRALAAGVQKVRATNALVARRPDDVGIARIERDVHEAGGVTDVLEVGPRLAAVGRLVEAAFLVGRPSRAQRGDVRHVLVARVHDNPANMLRLLEPARGPRAPTVGGLEHAAAGRHRVARVGLARAVVHGVGVIRRDGDHAAGRHVFVLEHRAECGARVGGLEQPTASARDVEGARGPRNARYVHHSALVVGGADCAPAKGGH